VRCGVVWFVEIRLRDAGVGGGGAPSQGYAGGILRLTGAGLPSLTRFAKGIVTEWTRQRGFLWLAR